MRSISAAFIFTLVCHYATSEIPAYGYESLPSLGFNLFNKDWCPELKLYNGEKLDVGCFDSVLGFFPLEPKEIDPTYSMYKSENSSRLVRRWKYDDPLTHEGDGILESDSRVALIVHGFRDQDTSDWMVDMKDEILKLEGSEKRAVILLDWSKGAEGPNYARAASNIHMLARVTAELLNRLVKRFDLNTDNLHLIGHSLGGQTIGQVTAWLNEKYGIRVGRATGLDVASPLFEERSIWPRKNDSKFLEGIHTSSGASPVTGDFGLTVNFAHIDLYPNGGKAFQPGCSALDMSCSHNLCRTFYTDFLKSCAAGCQYMGTLCRSVACAEENHCSGRTLELCEHTQRLSQEEPGQTNQIVYLDTTSETYTNRCQGQNTTEAN